MAIEQTSKNRTAIVTGAGKGIGATIAFTLASRGSNVVINDIDSDALGNVAERISSETKSGVEVVPGDIALKSTGKLLAERAQDRFGSCDILVNNAGGAFSNACLTDDMSEADWRVTLDINLTGAFFCTQAVLPAMRSNGYGRIVNIASTAGLNLCAVPVASYSAAKAGLIGFTRHVAFEAAPWGVTVNCVCPGHIATPTMLAVEAKDEESRKLLTRQVPVGRLGTPEDIAEAVLFLASEQASFICGSTLVVDGGLLLGYVAREEWFR